MRLSRTVRLLGEFLGFLMVSIGGTLVCIGLLLILSRLGMGELQMGSLVHWLNLILGSWASGVTMLAAGVCLVRRFKT
jgi:hypothetical protein